MIREFEFTFCDSDLVPFSQTYTILTTLFLFVVNLGHGNT